MNPESSIWFAFWFWGYLYFLIKGAGKSKWVMSGRVSHVHMLRITSTPNRRRSVKSSRYTRRVFCLWIASLFLISAVVLVFYILHMKDEDQRQFSSMSIASRGREVLSQAINEVMQIKQRYSHSAVTNGVTPVQRTKVDPSAGLESNKITNKITEKVPDKAIQPASALPLASEPSLDFDEIHFIHIPKCGGTTMTAVLRQIQCQRDSVKYSDCCLNPGFCDWHAFRRCSSIKGCINHFPQRYLFISTQFFLIHTKFWFNCTSN